MGDYLGQHQFFSPADGVSQAPPPTTASERKSHNQQPRIRRRNRLITSCLECRRRKLKCDKSQPCTNCTKFSRDCVFLAPALDPAGQAKLAEVKEKMGILERTLEEGVARQRSSSTPKSPDSGAAPLPGQEDYQSDEEAPEDEVDLEPTTLATQDAAYYDDVDGDFVDLGVQLGKMRITERVGGFVRPRLNEELAQALKEVPQKYADTPNPFAKETEASVLAPRDFLAPTSSLFFAGGTGNTSLMQYLPSKVLADKLMDHYWRAVHVIARTLHQCTFRRDYIKFWHDVAAGVEPRVSFQAVVLAALMSSAISMDEERVFNEFAVSKDSLVDNFKKGTEAALAKANFLRTTRLETLQAFVMYLIPLCRSSISRAHSALTGTLIRLAECNGLHRDPSLYGLSPVEVHVRRLLWYQICFLDLRTCEATGPRPQIRREDYDTKFPLNVDDVDLESPSGKVPTEDRKYFTDMTITRMRFECYEMHRLIWTERVRIERKKTTLTSLLSKVQAFCAAMEKTYVPMLDKRIPLHFVASQIYGILSSRMHVMVLSNYASNADRLMPERLRQILIGSAVLILEHSRTFESTTALGLWHWYVGALHQYHTALLLVSELYAKPREPALEKRIWKCLDWAFEMPEGLSGGQKCSLILGELERRTEVFLRLRRVRAPSTMAHAGPRLHAHEYKRREEEREQERQKRSMSMMSGGSIANSQGSSTTSTENLSGFNLPVSTNLPDIDFSLRAMDAPASTGGIASSTRNLNEYANSFGSVSPVPGMPLSPQHGQGSDTSSSVNVGNLPNTGNNTGSPGDLNGMPEIDWNEWDKLFPPTDVNAGDIMIPPFSFPRFSPADLQSEMQWDPDNMQSMQGINVGPPVQ